MLKKRKRRFFKKLIIFELLQLFNYSDNIQYALCISYSSEFSVNDFIIVWSFIQYVSSVICFLRQDVFARILLAEKFLSSRATLYWYLDKKTYKTYGGASFEGMDIIIENIKKLSKEIPIPKEIPVVPKETKKVKGFWDFFKKSKD